MREPVIGDWNNPYDNTVIKNIDVLEDDGSVGNTIVATEYFAELCFAGWWRVNPSWLAENPPPAPPEPPVNPEPEDPPADPVDETASTPA